MIKRKRLLFEKQPFFVNWLAKNQSDTPLFQGMKS
jgi:hypothetical protein